MEQRPVQCHWTLTGMPAHRVRCDLRTACKGRCACPSYIRREDGRVGRYIVGSSGHGVGLKCSVARVRSGDIANRTKNNLCKEKECTRVVTTYTHIYIYEPQTMIQAAQTPYCSAKPPWSSGICTNPLHAKPCAYSPVRGTYRSCSSSQLPH